MMKKIRLGAALGIIGILLAAPVLADYSGAQYEGGISIENAGDTVSGVSVFLEMNTESFMDAEYLEDDYSNVWFTNASGNSMAFMPVPAGGGVPSGDWCFFYPWSLPGSGQANAVVYMGGPDMTPPIRYIPASSGMTIVDTAALELGNNFEIEQKGYVDMSSGANKRLVYKASAFETVVEDGKIVSEIVSASSTDRPTGHDDPSAAWTNEAQAYDGATSWGCYTTTLDAWLELTFPSATTDAISVLATGGDGSGYHNPTELEVECWYDGAWHHLADEVVGAAWDSLDLPTGMTGGITKVRLRFPSSGYNPATFIASYIGEVQWTEHVAVVADLSSGAHTVKTTADGTTMKLYIDGDEEDAYTLGGATVADNANAWYFCQNFAMPYMEYHKLTVSGALQQEIEWEDDTTFSDLSGNGHDVTPSFLAASSDADVTASLVSLEPYGAAEAPEYVIDESTGMISGAPDEPDNLYDEMDVDHIPGAEVLNALLDAGGIPRSLVWFPLTFAVVTFVSIVVYKASRSLFAMSLTAGALLIFASRTGIVPFWVAIPFILLALGILVKERTVSL